MDLETSLQNIRSHCSEMDTMYQRTLFDETAIVYLPYRGNSGLYYYDGPRAQSFMDQFLKHTRALRESLPSTRAVEPGEFGFTDEGEGLNMDAYICLNENIFLFLNNTMKSMMQIRQDPYWRQAQSYFIHLAHLFHSSPINLGPRDKLRTA